ncbi:nickel superoxide dismutase [Persephonella hydrogeniphila]|uniref:Nickel superoxide dismutase n=1 Tax=Persephonella hydrogeniphila TaxID=198703 RepID=A0A285NL95_9AQUI|nr:superoxide dismutase [Ni] [Persephonella hydrogeniphila]SNZ10304.1 nickel superoxide dismutase [Persephonella hydrogeniphila]
MRNILALWGVITILIYSGKALAHCEIPCGIYDDHLRIHLLEEHITTMEKSIKKIKELSEKNDPHSKNQLIRWIMNKEKHAKEFQYIVWQYFLTQRIKPINPEEKEKYRKYIKKVELLHKLSFFAMKVKQNVDTKYTDKLRKLLSEFEKLYFGKKESYH